MPTPKRKRWSISELDIQKAEEVLKRTKPPVTHEEAVAFYIELWDQYAEMFEKYKVAAKKIPRLEHQLTHWRNKANRLQPRLTPMKYD